MKVYRKIWNVGRKHVAYCAWCDRVFVAVGKSRKAAKKEFLAQGLRKISTEYEIGNLCAECRDVRTTDGDVVAPGSAVAGDKSDKSDGSDLGARERGLREVLEAINIVRKKDGIWLHVKSGTRSICLNISGHAKFGDVMELWSEMRKEALGVPETARNHCE